METGLSETTLKRITISLVEKCLGERYNKNGILFKCMMIFEGEKK